jgi:hypothetical protein
MTGSGSVRGLTLAEILLLAVSALLLVALLLPLRGRAARLEGVMACRDRLRALHQARADFPVSPSDRGQAFWTRLAEATPPRIAREALRCPLVQDPRALACHYLGPSGDPAGLEPQDPLGCDDLDNHGPQGRRGGNVLLKSGEVRTDEGVLWRQALGRCSR